ncbi:MAG: hypothetical protein WAO78_11860 [Roseovarius sp.]
MHFVRRLTAALCGLALVAMTLSFGASAGARIEASALTQSAAALGIAVEQNDICASQGTDPRHCPLCHVTSTTACARPDAPGMIWVPATAVWPPCGGVTSRRADLPQARAPPRAS